MCRPNVSEARKPEAGSRAVGVRDERTANLAQPDPRSGDARKKLQAMRNV